MYIGLKVNNIQKKFETIDELLIAYCLAIRKVNNVVLIQNEAGNRF